MRHPLSPGPAARRRTAALLAHPRPLSSLALALGRALARRPVELAKSLEAVARAVEQLDWVRQFNPDLIHAHWASYPSTAALALGRLLGKPFGFTCHAHDIFVHDHLLREKLESAAVPVTISRYNVEWLAEHVTARAGDRLTVVHCGVDLPGVPFRDGGREEDLIVTVGRLNPIKGFDVLVDALGELDGGGAASAAGSSAKGRFTARSARASIGRGSPAGWSWSGHAPRRRCGRRLARRRSSRSPAWSQRAAIGTAFPSR